MTARLIQNRTILIAPLDWGLGHATRCVPLVRKLSKHNRMILGVTETTRFIFDDEFPDLEKISLPPYAIRYSKYWPVSVKLLFDAPRIFGIIKNENTQLKQIIQKFNIDCIISDNRFGLYHQDVESIYMTHQLQIQAGLFSRLANVIHEKFIQNFDKIWVPDFEDSTRALAGNLSRNFHFKNVEYIEALSRLNRLDDSKDDFDYLCLLSGPEPLRTQIEEKLILRANATNKRIVFVRGSNKLIGIAVNTNVTIINMPNSDELSRLICSSKTVLCRSGYSTLMDLYALKKKRMVLIPTPGQSEQLYLAQYWHQKFGAKILFEHQLASFQF